MTPRSRSSVTRSDAQQPPVASGSGSGSGSGSVANSGGGGGSMSSGRAVSEDLDNEMEEEMEMEEVEIPTIGSRGFSVATAGNGNGNIKGKGTSKPRASTSVATTSRAGTSEAGAGSSSEQEEEEEEEAWDEVEIPSVALAAAAEEGAGAVDLKGKGKALPGIEEALEITLTRQPKAQKPDKSAVLVLNRHLRRVKQETHKTHLGCLLAAVVVRNRWLNDELLHARLLSLVPLSIQNSFFSFSRQTHPNERDRSRLFLAALERLLNYWSGWFELEGEKGLRKWGWEEVERLSRQYRVEIDLDDDDDDDGVESPSTSKKPARGSSLKNTKKKGKSKKVDPELGLQLALGSDEMKDSKSLMKRLVLRQGSADASTLLFTALCRGLDIPARLVVSLQPVGYRIGKGAAAAGTGKGKGGKQGKEKRKKEKDSELGTGSEDAELLPARKKRKVGTVNGAAGARQEKEIIILSDTSVGTSSKSRYVPPVKLRRTKSKSKTVAEEDDLGPPTSWTEVYSRTTKSWIALDPVRGLFNCAGKMEPSSKHGGRNELFYVVALEDDGTARDVTARYAKHFQTQTLKKRVPSSRGQEDTWGRMLHPFRRGFHLNRDAEEDIELGGRQAHERMPESISGFKDHPNYVLERHIKRDEAVDPAVKPLGTFKGVEKVYPRSALWTLKSQENYLRVGRVVKEGEEPVKLVKARAVTINRKRQQEAMKLDGQEEEMQPLYAYKQTELYVPPEVGEDGKIPKNDFGNIDLYTESMLPKGATHVPHKLAAKCAKALGIDYAEAVTGFEFRQRRALPVLSGVVVASSSATLLREAIANQQEAQEEKERDAKEERARKGWRKMILGLRVRERLVAEYGKAAGAAEAAAAAAAEVAAGDAGGSGVKKEET